MPAQILLIEDNPANLYLMTYLLGAFGYIPSTATDGPSGLAAARDERPDLIICDVQLPGMDGLELARYVKSDPALRATPLVSSERSEEHTSELQSQSNLVCRLLLEKKH